MEAAICVELVPYLRAIAPDIYSAARAHLSARCPDLLYDPRDLDFDLETHLNTLCELVPPIEYRRPAPADRALPATLASILNVGWAALLTRLDEIPESADPVGDVIARKMERLHALLLKAVELSEVRGLWEESRDGSLNG